jgi:hypothetical protein
VSKKQAAAMSSHHQSTGLALIFYDPREFRFVVNSRLLEQALERVGFVVRRLPSENIVNQVQIELANSAGFDRLVFAYSGHGSFSAPATDGDDQRARRAHRLMLEGGLCDKNGKVVPVLWLKHAAERAFPSTDDSPRPKLFILDTCHDADAAGPGFQVDAPDGFEYGDATRAEQPRDFVVVSAAEAGYKSWSGIGKGYMATFARCVSLHRGVPERDVGWLHSETERLIRSTAGGDDGMRFAVPPLKSSLRSGCKLYLSQPQSWAEPPGLFVDYSAIQDALAIGRCRDTPDGPGAVRATQRSVRCTIACFNAAPARACLLRAACRSSRLSGGANPH